MLLWYGLQVSFQIKIHIIQFLQSKQLTMFRHINIQWDGHEGDDARSNRIIVARTKLPIL